MKRLLTIVCVFGFVLAGVAQDIVDIPDANFKTLLLAEADANNDGELQQSEANTIREVAYYSGATISDLTGIKSLTFLKEIFVSTVVSSSIDLGGLEYLTKVVINNEKLVALNVQGCVSLQYLSCEQASLQELDLSELSALKNVYVSDNFLTSVDFSGCESLNTVHLMDNYLTSLDFTSVKSTVLSLQAKGNTNLKEVCAPSKSTYFSTSLESNTEINEHCICENTSSSISEISCDSYLAPSGAVYYETGVYEDIIPNALGCDSIITIDLTVNESTARGLSKTVCDSYSAPDGKVYTESGFYEVVIENAVGCDSTIYLDLTVDCSKVTATQEAHSSSKQILRAYTPMGTEVPKATKGQLLILEYSDGSREKIFVKED